MMKCECCGRYKKIFESFEEIAPNINLCVQCSTLLYKLRDSKSENDITLYISLQDQLSSMITDVSSKAFIDWYEEFK